MTHDVSRPEIGAALIDAAPLLSDVVALASVLNTHERVLLHAGPPYREPAEIPAPVLNAAAAAAVVEGWEENFLQARCSISAGRLPMRAAQDHGVVTPLAFVASPSMPMMRVEVPSHGIVRYSPLNDGWLPDALRFGSTTRNSCARLRTMIEIGPDLAIALREPVPMMPILAMGLAGGDDLHGTLGVANDALVAILAPRLTGAAAGYVRQADHLVLNAVMATCACLLSVTAPLLERGVLQVGANGVDFGWKFAGATDWQRTPAHPPRGVLFEGASGKPALPAIGDSIVIDACGFGAAALRERSPLAGQLREAGAPFVSPERMATCLPLRHSALPEEYGLGFRSSNSAAQLAAILAILDATGEGGLIGRGTHVATLGSVQDAA